VTDDQRADDQRKIDAGAPRSNRAVLLGGVVIAALGLGWFVLSHGVMHTSIGDAAGEALGVMLALLVVASVVGAVRSGRSRD
jgi:hypothetical protein